MPTTAAANPARLLRVPAPDCQPPYDDELGPRPRPPAGSPLAVQGALALAFVLPSGVPSAPVAPPGLHLVPAAHPPEDDGTDEFGPLPTPRLELPDPRGWGARLVQAVVEVLAGDRPLPQLVRWTTTEVYEQVAAALTRRTPPAAEGAARSVVRSVHVSEPRDGVAEVAGIVRCGARATAVALRLEGLDGRWQCTALAMG